MTNQNTSQLTCAAEAKVARPKQTRSEPVKTLLTRKAGASLRSVNTADISKLRITLSSYRRFQIVYGQ